MLRKMVVEMIQEISVLSRYLDKRLYWIVTGNCGDNCCYLSFKTYTVQSCR